MSQERIARSQFINLIDSKVVQVRQDLQRDLDPFQEGPVGERLRAVGLRNFCFQMADPSLQFLESTVGILEKLPFSNINHLQYDITQVEADPQRFFAQYGIVTGNFNEFKEGVSHAREFIRSVANSYSLVTGKPYDDFNAKAVAEFAYKNIQLKKGSLHIINMTRQVRNEFDLRERCRKGLSIRRLVKGFLAKFPLVYIDHGGEQIDLTWENALRYPETLSRHLSERFGFLVENINMGQIANTAQAAIQRYPFERRLAGLPSIDRMKFHQLRLQYGAKAANLIVLSVLAGDINRLRDIERIFSLRMAVPEFLAVPVNSYQAWREGKLIDEDLQPYFGWASELREDSWGIDEPEHADYIVRSSAVFSEDGENTTGAGIYESVRVRAGATFQEFKDAVIRVYASTHSLRAQAYRKWYGIDTEEMGLVIQKFVSPFGLSSDYESRHGYLNSRLAGVPRLMEITTVGSRNFVNRAELDFFLALDVEYNEDAFQTLHHFLPDLHRTDPKLIIKTAQLASVVERIWDKDIQLEFVAAGPVIYFVQVRELPASELQSSTAVEFPNEPPIHCGASVGIGDMELPVLDDKDDNSNEVGVVMFKGNSEWSMAEDNVYRLPKEGAVIVCSDSGQSGHIQTLCVERELMCIFPDANIKDGQPVIGYDELSKLNRIRIVSNGIEGRVYEIP